MAEDDVYKGDKRGERSEDDEGVDIGVTEEVGVGENGEKEDECGGKEALGGVDSERVLVDKPKFTEKVDANSESEMLECS
ncbi:uncharacterized protein DS421_3g87480 [Arachis hypogaea]|nr:uncharacterized protein DS421_3g87480 [Arachis hypogaea]